MNDTRRIENIPDKPTHALHVIDNWDGYEDENFVFAFELGGVFYHHANGRPVLEYMGDKVLHAWPLQRQAVGA